MKKTRKLISLLMALAMIFALAIPAFAEDETTTYTITIENSVTGSLYTAYKVFDATYTGTAPDEHVAYTISESDAWYSLVNGNDSPFALTETSTSGTYNVTLKDGKTETTVAAWFNAITSAQLTANGITSDSTATGNGGSVAITVDSAGYYYITTTTGSTVTVTTAKPNATVIDKNQTPGGDLTKTVSDTEAQIGDTVNYTITSNVPAYDGETKITKYTFTDTLSYGLTAPDASAVTVQILEPDENSSEIKINDKSYSIVANLTGSDAVTVSGQTITITFDPTSINNYPADAMIIITYSATVNADAAYANGNSVTQTWTDDSTGKTVTETVYTYGFNLQKVDGTTKKQLDGAKFKLYTAQTGGNAIEFVEVYDEDGTTVIGYKVADENSTENTTDTIEVGYAYIFGLDADVTYYLEETQAPDGYNMLKNRVSVTIETDKTSENDGVLTISQLVTVENEAGSTLPSTGGMGTTLFYIFGGALVLCAVVLLVTRRRMDNEQ